MFRWFLADNRQSKNQKDQSDEIIESNTDTGNHLQLENLELEQPISKEEVATAVN